MIQFPRTTVRPNLHRMSTEYERLAEVRSNAVYCPYCGSGRTVYAEERTVTHVIRFPPDTELQADGGDMMLVVDEHGQMLELASGERILCRDCIRDSGIPAMCEVIFD